jgi:hypothetical protein
VALILRDSGSRCMLISHHPNTGYNYNINLADVFCQSVTGVRHLVITVTNQNYIQEEYRRRISSGNAGCQSVYSNVTCRLQSKEPKDVHGEKKHSSKIPNFGIR